MGLTLEAEPGPRTRNPRIMAAWLAISIGAMLCVHGLGAAQPPSLLSTGGDQPEYPREAMRLGVGSMLLVAGVAGLVMTPPAAGDEAATSAATKRSVLLILLVVVPAFIAMQATGVLVGIRREVKVGSFALLVVVALRLCGSPRKVPPEAAVTDGADSAAQDQQVAVPAGRAKVD